MELNTNTCLEVLFRVILKVEYIDHLIIPETCLTVVHSEKPVYCFLSAFLVLRAGDIYRWNLETPNSLKLHELLCLAGTVDDLYPQLDPLLVLKVPSRRNKVWLFYCTYNTLKVNLAFSWTVIPVYP